MFPLKIIKSQSGFTEARMIITDYMTIEEIMYQFDKEYGEDFNWIMIPLSQSNGYFVDELKRELDENDIFLRNKIWAVAKCTSNDDVLFLSEGDICRIYHLTYSRNNEKGFPQYVEFMNKRLAFEYIQNQFITEYL